MGSLFQFGWYRIVFETGLYSIFLNYPYSSLFFILDQNVVV